MGEMVYRRKTAAVLLVVASPLLWTVARADLKITAPSTGITVIAGRTFTVDWTGGTANEVRVGIDLYYCGEDCDDADDCGEWITALCPYGVTGCADNEGDYDIVMPEPPHETGNFKVQVFDVVTGESGCSGAFSLLPQDEAPTPEDPDGPSLTVISPMENDGAVAGETYTVEFEYDNGVGSSVDRFKIDLYAAEGSADCGTWIASVCDKPEIGCKDSTGDYDVEIPSDTTLGWYRMRVGRFEDDSVYGCSGRFTIHNEDASPPPVLPSSSSSFSSSSGSYDHDRDNDQSFSYDLLLPEDDDLWSDDDGHDDDVDVYVGGDVDDDVLNDDDDDDAGEQEKGSSDGGDDDLSGWMWADDDVGGEGGSSYSYYYSYAFLDHIADDWQES